MQCEVEEMLFAEMSRRDARRKDEAERVKRQQHH